MKPALLGALAALALAPLAHGALASPFTSHALRDIQAADRPDLGGAIGGLAEGLQR